MGYRRTVAVEGNLTLNVLDAKTERILRSIRTKNLWPKIGLDQLIELILYPIYRPSTSFVPFVPNYISLGSIGGATTIGTLVLGDEVFRKEIMRRIPHPSGNPGWTYFLRVESSEANGTGSQPIREVGLNAKATGGYVFARAPLATEVNKTSAIALTIEWENFLVAS